MTSTLSIPAAGIADTREALLCLLNRPVEAIAHTLTLPERELRPEWFEDDRRDFVEVWPWRLRVCGPPLFRLSRRRSPRPTPGSGS
jgi:hypothetical protein